VDLLNYNINHLDFNQQNQINPILSQGFVDYPSFEDITNHQPKNTNNPSQNINSFFDSK
jgi:hypothetical protein